MLKEYNIHIYIDRFNRFNRFNRLLKKNPPYLTYLEFSI